MTIKDPLFAPQPGKKDPNFIVAQFPQICHYIIFVNMLFCFSTYDIKNDSFRFEFQKEQN